MRGAVDWPPAGVITLALSLLVQLWLLGFRSLAVNSPPLTKGSGPLCMGLGAEWAGLILTQ